MEEYARELLKIYPPYKHANAVNGHCRDCDKLIGLGSGECIGWHPTFKCVCGYETTHPAAGRWTSCIHCGATKQPIVDDILDAEIVDG